MRIRNIFEPVASEGLEVHEDLRGRIADIFFKQTIHHVNLIESAPGAERGNHYHKKTEQHILITQGSLEYWYWDESQMKNPNVVVADYGDVVTSPPGEIHALRIGPSGCKFITFSIGQRGGADYETDTFRTESIIGNPVL